ncbi:MAG: DNA-3-methyladenine glycosylase 2 family protein, partial [Candidatus Limnocylindrales bacterium]
MPLPNAVLNPQPPDAEASLPIKGPYDLGRTLGPLGHGRGDPTVRVEADRVQRATRTPEGPASEELTIRGRSVHIRAWGPGAAWAVAHAPDLLGFNDHPAVFRPDHPLLDRFARSYAGIRIGRSEAVFEALVPAVLEQKITGDEARRVYRALIRTHGDDAPGPLRLR